MTFDSGRTKNQVNFGIETSPNNVSFVSVEGFDADKAKFSKYDSKEKKNYTEEVEWEDRFEFDMDGYQPFFGTRVGLELDAKGKPTISNMFGYDAAQELSERLTDEMGVYVEGQIKFSSYKKNDELKRYKNFIATKVYAQKSEVDFEDDKFKEENRFEQEIVFIGIDQEKDPETNKPTGRFIVDAKIVTYDGVEDATFIIEDKELAGKIKKGLKPYYGIQVLGRLVTKIEADDTTSSDDAWGSDDDMDSHSGIKFKEMVITKAYPASIDKESYTEEKLASVKKAEDDFGDIKSDNSSDSGDDEVW
jgi:single-stranded DNA-binding protein